MRIAKKYTAVFFAIIVLSLLTLCAASLMPQSRILANMQESVGQFEAEGAYPHMLDKDSKANKQLKQSLKPICHPICSI